MAALSFSDLDDADVFYTKVTTREITTKKTSSKKKKGNLFTTLNITLLS